jgi:hypothetical protein
MFVSLTIVIICEKGRKSEGAGKGEDDKLA